MDSINQTLKEKINHDDETASSVTTMSAKDQPVTSVLPTENGALAPLSSEKKTKAVARLLKVNDPHQVDKSLVSSLESLTAIP